MVRLCASLVAGLTPIICAVSRVTPRHLASCTENGARPRALQETGTLEEALGQAWTSTPSIGCGFAFEGRGKLESIQHKCVPL